MGFGSYVIIGYLQSNATRRNSKLVLTRQLLLDLVVSGFVLSLLLGLAYLPEVDQIMSLYITCLNRRGTMIIF